MQLKNNLKCHAQFFFYKKEGKESVLDVVHVPAGATVEINDEIWEAVRKTKTEVEVMEERLIPLDKDNIGANVELGDEKYFIKEYFATGERKTVSLVDEMVRKGELKILSKVAVTVEQIDKFLNGHNISVKDMDEDTKMALYDKLA